jgi:hypothetical protein
LFPDDSAVSDRPHLSPSVILGKKSVWVLILAMFTLNIAVTLTVVMPIPGKFYASTTSKPNNRPDYELFG